MLQAQERAHDHASRHPRDHESGSIPPRLDDRGRSRPRRGSVDWHAPLSILALLLLLGGVIPLLLTGCDNAPRSAAAPSRVEALRRDFPVRAAEALRGYEPFVATSAGFAAAPGPDPTAALTLRGGLSAALPRRAEEPIRFHVLGGFEIAVREVGASGDGALAGDVVAYPRRGGTSFWSVTDAGYEEWLYLERGIATGREPVAAWEVDGATLREADGAVEIADASGAARLRVTAPAAFARGDRPVATRLAARGATIELWVDAGGEAVLVDPVWTTVGSMSSTRARHTATLLQTGKVLIAGGHSGSAILATAELYNPLTGTFSSAGSMSLARQYHEATLLSDGKVLVTGGYLSTGTYTATTEVYNPATNTWSTKASMSVARGMHVATLLQNNRVLVTCGYGNSSSGLSSVELYDPSTNTWTTKASTPTPHRSHTATLLSDGKVLVAGGYNSGSTIVANVEVYNYSNNTWTVKAPMTAARRSHTATLLGDGGVLVVAGYDGTTTLASAERYDPASDTWTARASMSASRYFHTATLLPNGKVAVTGGSSPSTPLASVQIYDPSADAWGPEMTMFAPRMYQTATLLATGKLLVAGGFGATYLSSAEVLDPLADTWSPAASIGAGRVYHSATTLVNGKVWIAGGYDGSAALATSKLYDPAYDTWTDTASLSATRYAHTATPLTNNQVLVAGGYDGSAPRASAEVYNPSNNTFVTSVGALDTARRDHTATRLSNGKVLVAGGCGAANSSLASAEIYDPSTKQWSLAASMATPRCSHTAALLANGKVLVAGGTDDPAASGAVASAEIYDPATDAWTPAASMSAARARAAMTTLDDGRVLVAGGVVNGTSLSSAELYDSAANAWTAAASMGAARGVFTMTKLSSGWVLVAGGLGAGGSLSTVEIYDPVAAAWLSAASMSAARAGHGAALVTGGKLLMTGGAQGATVLASSELYTPVSPDDNNSCTVDAWNPALGQLTHTTLPNGAACDDGNACTQTDTCQSGVCMGNNPVVCTASDQCHYAGTCNPGTGACSNPVKPNATPCNDGNGCTQSDKCQSGVCVGTNPVVCTALNECHDVGTCDPSAGACSNPIKPIGTACSSDGNVCTTDACDAAGACAHPALADGTSCGSGVVCSGASCAAGCFIGGAFQASGAVSASNACQECAPSASTTAWSNRADGTSCDDADACTQVDTCQAGSCAGDSPVACDAPPDACHTVAGATCDIATGECSYPSVVCTALDECHSAGTCDPVSGCSNPVLSSCLAPGPRLYADSQHQSPVRGDPGEILLLAGTNFDLATTFVVYMAVSDPTVAPSPPSPLPSSQSSEEGVIDTNVWRGPHGIKVRLPEAMKAGKTYALWAVTPDPVHPGYYDYSNHVFINDARPMWITPGPRKTAPGATAHPYMYSSADRPGIGRVLKIVGRNLQPVPEEKTRVLFTSDGETSYLLFADDDGQESTSVERYVAQVTLPSMELVNDQATDYEVEISRDGESWVPAGMVTILPDPAPIAEFRPNDYGDGSVVCDPCVSADHTLCISRALHAARRHVTPRVDVSCTSDSQCASNQICKANGKCGNAAANVVFDRGSCGDGIWHVATNCDPNGVGYLQDNYFMTSHPGGPPVEPGPYGVCSITYGFPVYPGVNLVADQGAPTRPVIQTEDGFDQPVFTKKNGADPGADRQYLFELTGDNLVEGLRFKDAYSANAPGSNTFLLGGHDLVIVDNVFDRTYAGIGSRNEAMPPEGYVSNVVIADNQFGCWVTGAAMPASVDSVISRNVFLPGGDAAPIAASTIASRRVDISSNFVNGENPDYADSKLGFRAGFFLPTFGPQEHVLLASNTIACTGTRHNYDGEAISFDSNGDITPFRSSELVVGSPAPSTTEVSIGWPGSSILPASWALGRWLRIDHGPGLGQGRKIVAVSPATTTVTYTVSPPFDVAPVAGQSRVIIGNPAWQAYVVDNVIDDTCSVGLVTPENKHLYHFYSTGVIMVYSSGSDVAIESNHLSYTSGIEISAFYTDDTTVDKYTHKPQYFVDVRANEIVGKFGGIEEQENLFGSGIGLSVLSSTRYAGVVQPNPNHPGFGVTVAHNVITDAARRVAGWAWGQYAAIGIWTLVPPQESSSPGFIDTLIFSNHVERSDCSGPSCIVPPACTDGVQNLPSLPYYDSAVSVGASATVPGGALNYPHGTVLCDNEAVNFGCNYTDWPPLPSMTSSVSLCE